ncbi:MULTISPECIES: ABC transporter substrate-binding protein [unclassified Pseudomonas]|uniref:ABC transporter substrate-binding protein n=1 Tax=unclassified Pseudomonas TaxID=196821 RepID=UPI000BC4D7F6|nr:MULTISPECIES: ABC transporter substrate-binding protein [unclassified Pseudomonas]PVZ12376.1 polar amino acid transport system substrate-binding protein [Pseudomonas sp. URIL14HWK12:I12]PVZ23472.1 polar amino acid transport system substrate-binding protein [Pseudomonas sp. URIL14HWK12:I10]PVZ32802.1 polar amino acid transport system substrate-binding protein [Pseudomonas sp. URIL14HWK12:I11]SNZ14132.1 amino acid ABC transporter substrate-binding protein, PAAT family (TC 3.A.1.3.-) [Pseudomon
MLKNRLKLLCCLVGFGATVVQADALTVPARLASTDKLVYCSSLDSPPISFVNSQNSQPDGLAVDLGNEIAKKLGKKAEWRAMPFAGIIPALLARQCDLVVTQLFDKPERRKIIDMVDYTKSSQTIVVNKGNAEGIHDLSDLSARKVAVLNGSTIKSILDAKSDELVAQGRQPINLVVFNSDSDAFQALRIKQVVAYGTTSEFSAYYQSIAPGLFEDAVPSFAHILAGIGVRKDDRELGRAVETLLKNMRSDGSYQKLFEKWKIQDDMLQPGEGNPLVTEGGA